MRHSHEVQCWIVVKYFDDGTVDHVVVADTEELARDKSCLSDKDAMYSSTRWVDTLLPRQ